MDLHRITVSRIGWRPSIDIAFWGRGQAVDRGDFCRYLNNCYVARLPVRQGRAAESCCGATSDGAVTCSIGGGSDGRPGFDEQNDIQ